MKLLLVLGSDDNYETISRSVQPLGFEIIRYRHVMKAMDNLDEIDPQAIMVSARDFPRHWKILVQFVRSERPKEACPVVLLKASTFSTEETSKAFFLGANGVLDDALEAPGRLDRLQNIMGRYVPVHEKRRNIRYTMEPWHHVGFIAANLCGSEIAVGNVRDISLCGLSFVPGKSGPPKEARLHEEFGECSLRVGDAILSPTCRLVRTGKTVCMEFVRFPKGEKRILEEYLEEFPLVDYGYSGMERLAS